jgi:hypothetical protein
MKIFARISFALKDIQRHCIPALCSALDLAMPMQHDPA